MVKAIASFASKTVDGESNCTFLFEDRWWKQQLLSLPRLMVKAIAPFSSKTGGESNRFFPFQEQFTHLLFRWWKQQLLSLPRLMVKAIAPFSSKTGGESNCFFPFQEQFTHLLFRCQYESYRRFIVDSWCSFAQTCRLWEWKLRKESELSTCLSTVSLPIRLDHWVRWGRVIDKLTESVTMIKCF